MARGLCSKESCAYTTSRACSRALRSPALLASPVVQNVRPTYDAASQPRLSEAQHAAGGHFEHAGHAEAKKTQPWRRRPARFLSVSGGRAAAAAAAK
jgi:hypothetical protein